MKLTQDQKQFIKISFQSLNSKEDLLKLLNETKSFMYKESYPFKMKNLNYYITRKNNVAYSSFDIPKKKKGEFRTIYAPNEGLKELQVILNTVLQAVYEPHPSAYGFVLGKSIVDNAKSHTNKNYVFNIDLKDFFTSIEKQRVWGRLLVKPFNLGSSSERKKIASIIAKLASIYSIDGTREVLPQGAPTSPILTNAICEKLDIKLTGLAKRFGLIYSRYADDITFSSMHNEWEENGKFEKIYNEGSTFRIELSRIIEEQRLVINVQKIRLQKRGYKQEVTGLIVNDKINVSKKYIKQLRHWIYFIERFGIDKAAELFEVDYLNKTIDKNKRPNFILVLQGKLLYLKMVRGFEDNLYVKLQNRLDKAIGKVDKLEEIIKTWETSGIEKAMQKGEKYPKFDLEKFNQIFSSTINL